VNCARVVPSEHPPLDVPEADWDTILETKLTETFRACRAFGRRSREATGPKLKGA
jgi:hypothetical protein